MDWFADIIKNLTISKTLVFAVFITTTVMHFGPTYAVNFVPKFQPEYATYLFAIMVLTGVLLLFWGLAAVWHLTCTSMRGAVRIFRSPSLSQSEVNLLFSMGNDPTQPMDLDRLDYSRAEGTKLEFHQLAKQLEEKGLVRINPWNDNLLTLTDLGRDRALTIQQATNRRNVA